MYLIYTPKIILKSPGILAYGVLIQFSLKLDKTVLRLVMVAKVVKEGQDDCEKNSSTDTIGLITIVPNPFNTSLLIPMNIGSSPLSSRRQSKHLALP